MNDHVGCDEFLSDRCQRSVSILKTKPTSTLKSPKIGFEIDWLTPINQESRPDSLKLFDNMQGYRYDVFASIGRTVTAVRLISQDGGRQLQSVSGSRGCFTIYIYWRAHQMSFCVITMYGVILEHVQEAKYLGVNLSESTTSSGLDIGLSILLWPSQGVP